MRSASPVSQRLGRQFSAEHFRFAGEDRRFPRYAQVQFCIELAGFDPKVTLPHFAGEPRLFLDMELSQPFATSPESAETTTTLDPSLQPTPDYGSLGPGSDIAGPEPRPAQNGSKQSALRFAHLIAVVVGMVAALVVGTVSKARPIWPATPAAGRGAPASSRDLNQIDRMKPQKQAETLLELAVTHSQGAVEQISSRVDRWKGHVEWNPQIANLTTAALNSNDMRVRESGVEVEIAAYGLAKDSASVDYLLTTIDSTDHSQKIWALWALGLMANRGIDSGRVVQALTAELNDRDADSRRWAVEGLALAGTDNAIHALLVAMHDDAAPTVRERAACGVAASCMFTPEQRMAAVPKLLDYSEDPSLDAQTHGWAFQALADISHERLGNNTAAWRRWYETAATRE